MTWFLRESDQTMVVEPGDSSSIWHMPCRLRRRLLRHHRHRRRRHRRRRRRRHRHPGPAAGLSSGLSCPRPWSSRAGAARTATTAYVKLRITGFARSWSLRSIALDDDEPTRSRALDDADPRRRCRGRRRLARCSLLAVGRAGSCVVEDEPAFLVGLGLSGRLLRRSQPDRPSRAPPPLRHRPA